MVEENFNKMARTKIALLAVLVVGLLLVTNVSAATLQGLEWGIAEEDQFNFDITSTTNGTVDFTEIMYFECTDTPIIPNIVDTWSELTTADFDATWANGTTLGFAALIFIFYFVAIDHFAVPIGNFTLLGELYSDSSYDNGTLYDAGGYWGVDFDLLWIGLDADIHVDFLKTDGMLAHWDVATENGTMNMVRQNLPAAAGVGDILQLLQDNILYVAIGVGVLLIIVVLCKKK